MSSHRSIAVLVGSLRKDSLNKKMAAVLTKLAPQGLTLSVVEIGALPLYNFDDEANPPAAWTAFRQTIKPMAGVLFVTPEYNRSIPGALKNALDVGSRPMGASVWAKKPAAVVSVSPGALGAFGANHHLRQCLTGLDMPTMPQPELYVGGAGSLFNAAGDIENETTLALLSKFLNSFVTWVERNAP